MYLFTGLWIFQCNESKKKKSYKAEHIKKRTSQTYKKVGSSKKSISEIIYLKKKEQNVNYSTF